MIVWGGAVVIVRVLWTVTRVLIMLINEDEDEDEVNLKKVMISTEGGRK